MIGLEEIAAAKGRVKPEDMFELGVDVDAMMTVGGQAADLGLKHVDNLRMACQDLGLPNDEAIHAVLRAVWSHGFATGVVSARDEMNGQEPTAD